MPEDTTLKSDFVKEPQIKNYGCNVKNSLKFADFGISNHYVQRVNLKRYISVELGDKGLK